MISPFQHLHSVYSYPSHLRTYTFIHRVNLYMRKKHVGILRSVSVRSHQATSASTFFLLYFDEIPVMQSVRPTRCILFGCGWEGCTWIIQYTLSPRGSDDLWRYLGRFSGVGRSISAKEEEEQGRRCRNDVTSGLSHTTAVIPLIMVHYFAFCLAASWDTHWIFLYTQQARIWGAFLGQKIG